MGSPFQIPPSNRPLALANNRIAHSANRHSPSYRNQSVDYRHRSCTGAEPNSALTAKARINLNSALGITKISKWQVRQTETVSILGPTPHSSRQFSSCEPLIQFMQSPSHLLERGSGQGGPMWHWVFDAVGAAIIVMAGYFAGWHNGWKHGYREGWRQETEEKNRKSI